MSASLSGGRYRIKTGLETWLYGRALSLRGGVNAGSLKYRNAAVGLGYRKDRYEFDYAFTYPLSGISETYGSHQLSFIFRWGKVEEPAGFTWKELIAVAKGEELERRPREGELSPEKIAEAQELAIVAKADFSEGLYKAGLEKLTEAQKILRDDKEIAGLMKRLGVINRELSLRREFVRKQRADLGRSRRIIICIIVFLVATYAIWQHVLSPLIGSR